jgi:hypothetical protein
VLVALGEAGGCCSDGLWQLYMGEEAAALKVSTVTPGS